jgi:hypothetical protein
MKNWNVVISVFQDGFRRALHTLRELGPVAHCHYQDVLVIAVDEPVALLDAVKQATEAHPPLYDAIAQVALDE